MTDALLAITVGTFALVAAFSWMTFRVCTTPTSSPDRLVGELRLAQMGALLITFGAAPYWGFAAANEHRAGTGLDVALALGFLIIAAAAMTREPRVALTMLALAFAAHVVLDVLHRPGALPDIVPRWYILGCGIVDAYVGALCYLPILRR